jgi:hypothetical protein
MSARAPIVLVVALAAPFAGADPASLWQQPVEAVLPSTPISVEVPRGESATAWAEANGLERFEAWPTAGGTLVEVTMPAGGWDVERDRLCADASGCEPVQCQSVQLEVRWAGGERDPAVHARLVRRPPTLERILEAEFRPPGVCELADPYAEGVVMPTTEAGSATLDPASLPADAECFTLAVESACSVVSTPLDAVQPSFEPGRVLVLLAAADAGQAAAIGAIHGLTPVRVVPLRASTESLAVFALAPGQDITTVAAQLALDARVRAAQPDWRYRTAAEHSDPLAALAYGPAKSGATRLHAVATGKGVRVAVIDTGVDLAHPELEERVAAHADFTETGFTADLHGTAVAGIIAAAADNAAGAYGVAPGVELMAYKACQPIEPGTLAARCWSSTIVAALDAAIGASATIVNLSLSGPPDPLVARFVDLAVTQGRLVVAAAGNDGPLAKPAFPAALEGVIAVTATDARDRLYKSANEGDYIAHATPGVDVVAPAPGGTYPVYSGTSMAAAHSSAALALLREVVPVADAATLAHAIAGAAVDLGAAGRDNRYGDGRIDLCAAAERASGGAFTCPAPTP